MTNSALVIGAGIAGMQAALDLADFGHKVYLIEKTPSIGGRMSQLDKTFPTLDCSSCILTPKMVDTANHPNIEVMTYSVVETISGDIGNFEVAIRQKARYVNIDTCTGCGICVTKCPYKMDSRFDMGTGKQPAIHFEFPQAVPLVPTIDSGACIYFKNGKCKACQKYCPVEGCIDFDDTEKFVHIKVGVIIYATGFDLYDPGRNNDYGYNDFPDVITSLEFERLSSSTGPFGGHLLRPSNGEIPKNIGIILCVGSRSQLEGENFYCSRFCCMASIKQAILIKEHYPDTNVSIFYMDIRAFGKGFQEFYERAENQYKINFIKGKIGRVTNGRDNLTLRYEDIENGKISEINCDLVILAAGAENSKKKYPVPLKIQDDGFLQLKDFHIDPVSTTIDGILTAGTSSGPKDIPDTVVEASAAAMKATIILEGNK
ncbi:MAG: CoB--CoM heterodisulfide reductase iron-sulfur subunit A family protein [Candidatus Heimdallarchaeota archaeon]|nr:CoB--CoM heterodisulfide reductase iron-sulfur subunit A family protein [Candidatus Heimdallarchaeota archaeon]